MSVALALLPRRVAVSITTWETRPGPARLARRRLFLFTLRGALLVMQTTHADSGTFEGVPVC